MYVTSVGKIWRGESRGFNIKIRSIDDFMCPILAVTAPRWVEAPSKFYLVRFTAANDSYQYLPKQFEITNLHPLPVMESIDKPTGKWYVFVWSVMF